MTAITRIRLSKGSHLRYEWGKSRRVAYAGLEIWRGRKVRFYPSKEWKDLSDTQWARWSKIIRKLGKRKAWKLNTHYRQAHYSNPHDSHVLDLIRQS